MKQYYLLLQFGIGLLLVILALVVIDVFHISYPIDVTTSTRSSELSVVGEGKVEVVPDTAYVDVGIMEEGATVEEVELAINTKNDAIVAALKNQGIEEQNIKTSNYSIYPRYDYSGTRERIIGYSGNVTIAIKVPNTEETGEIIRQATQAGANRVEGTRFVVDDPDKFREAAREMAIENAKEEAKKLANTLGIRIGDIVNIVESTGRNNYPMPIYANRAESIGLGGGAPAADLEPGSQTITSVVTLYFEKY